MFLTNDAGSVVTEYSYTPTGGVAMLGQTGNNQFTYNAAAGAMQLGSSGLFRDGGEVYDGFHAAVISGAGDDVPDRPGTQRIKAKFFWLGNDPGPPSSPGSWVELNPQPFPPAPGSWVELNPQPFPPGASVALNPQPFPPAPGSWVEKQPGPQQSPANYSGNYSGNYHDPVNSPGIYPGDSPISWVTANPAGQTKDSPYHSAPAFEIKDWSFEVTNKTTIGSATTGAGGGKAKFNEFTIKKTTDSALPTFFKNCVAGAHYKSVIIKMRKSGGDPSSAGKAYLTYKFGTVFTTKIDWSGPGDEDPEETVTFVYGKLGVKYKPQKPDGSSTGGSTGFSPIGVWSSSTCTWCVQQ
jgi:type VI secretion system secreted protein Hcp